MPDFKENPQLALEVLKGITDEFAAGVISASQIGLTAPLLQRNQNEIHSFVNNHIASVARQQLENFWNENEVSDKLKKMKKLEKNALPSPAWRPRTGVIESNAIEAASIVQTKKYQEKNIQKMRKASMALQKELTDFQVLMDQQIKDISETSLSSITTKSPNHNLKQ